MSDSKSNASQWDTVSACTFNNPFQKEISQKLVIAIHELTDFLRVVYENSADLYIDRHFIEFFFNIENQILFFLNLRRNHF